MSPLRFADSPPDGPPVRQLTRPSSAGADGGSRAFRLQWQVGLYFVVATAVLIVPGLLLTERLLYQRLRESRLEMLRRTMDGVMGGINRRVQAAEERVARFAALIDAEPGSADPALQREFDRLVAKDPDGAWRSRRAGFRADREAGIFLPRFTEVTPALQSFLVRAKRLTETFGAGTLDPRLADAWVTPFVGGQVIFVPDQPTLVWESEPDEDDRQTEWITLADSVNNPEGGVRWTNPFHSVKTDAWFVSVLAPYHVAGRRAGSVGQDLSWEELVDYGAQTPAEAGARFLLIGRNGGVVFADTLTRRGPGRAEGLRLQDLPEPELRDTLERLLAHASSAHPTGPMLTTTAEQFVLCATVARTGWLVASVVPRREVEAALRGPIRTTRFAVLGGLAALLAISLVTIGRETRRRLANEEATRRSEERFIKLFELDPDGVCVTRMADSVLTEVNQNFIALTGWSREALVGHTTAELGLWAEPRQREEVFKTLDRDGICRQVSVTLRRRDGGLVEADFSARVVEMTDGPYLISIVRDVEERRRLERQLTQAQKMEAVGRLAGGVAHDFNNIMTAVMGYAQISSDSLPADSPLKEDMGEILRAAGRASELTRQLLAFARRQVTKPRAVDMNALLAETTRLIERLLGADITLTIEPQASLERVLIDPGQLEQVVVNLVVNARDAMASGGTLTIRTSGTREQSVLEVSDTGHGIPLDVQPLLFEPFFTTKAPGKGTGLGLATCYGIIRQAGGRIEVVSEPGKGATFRVVLPATRDLAGAGDMEPSHDAAAGMPRGTETVLIAEDEPPVRDLATRMLGGMGYTVISGSDGQDALARARRYAGPIHLLVTDLVMPGMSGWQLSQVLRVERPDLRVLYISGYTEDSEAIEEALRHGDGFLAKPFSITDLVRRVREILDG